MNCFRYLDFKSFEEVDRLTFAEYALLMEAVKLKQIDTDYRVHQQAFLNLAVKAQKKVGRKTKYIYSKFEKFYDYNKKLKEVKSEKQKSRFAGIGELLKKGV